jgi:hypothetical protein
MDQKYQIDGFVNDIWAHVQRSRVSDPQIERGLATIGLDGRSMARESIVRLSRWLEGVDMDGRAYARHQLGTLIQRIQNMLRGNL